jgi:hypothetical protein
MRCVRVAFVASDFCLPFPFPSSDHTAEPKRGQTLSSTEERIRRTGARGLATAPIGGTPGYVKPISRGANRGAGTDACTSADDAIELDSD